MLDTATKNLVRRLNRRLQKEYLAIRVSRGYERSNLGEFYLVNTYWNELKNYRLTRAWLATLATQLGVTGA
jgi:hypothetical protein